MKTHCPCADAKRLATVDDLADGIANAMIACAGAWITEADRPKHLRDAARYLSALADMVESENASEALHRVCKMLSTPQ